MSAVKLSLARSSAAANSSSGIARFVLILGVAPVKRLLPTLTLVAALAAASAAHAGPLASLRQAKLQAAKGTLAIKETRCPAGTTSNCGTAQLDERFDGTPRPKATSARGGAGFPSGMRIRGKGSATCSTASPATFTTNPDGSMQFLGSAARVVPGRFSATRIAMAGSRKGARIVWLEPLRPSFGCSYFGEAGTGLAVPSFTKELVSRSLGAHALKRSRFSVKIAGTQEWTRTDSDGTQVTGRASWKLRLDYRR
jgi:hypothetical protein